MEKREDIIYIRLTHSEKQRLFEKMNELGIKNISAYARKMLLDGYCVKLDLSDIRELVRLTGYAGNNLNQYTKCAHETHNIYAADVDDLKARFDQIISLQKIILERLSTI